MIKSIYSILTAHLVAMYIPESFVAHHLHFLARAIAIAKNHVLQVAARRKPKWALVGPAAGKSIIVQMAVNA